MINNEINIRIDLEGSHFSGVLESISNSNLYKTFTPKLGNQHKILY